MRNSIAAFLFALLLPYAANSQFIWEETFPYGTTSDIESVTANWTSELGNDPVPIVSGSLSYPNYPTNSGGDKISLLPDGYSIWRSFTSQSSSGVSVYVSFLVDVSDASDGGDYFFVINADGAHGGIHSKVFVKKVSSKLEFGIDRTDGTPIYTSGSYNFGETHLLVVKYTIAGGVNDDVVRLYVNPDLSGAEPSTGYLEDLDNGQPDLANLGEVEFGGIPSTSVSSLYVDGIRVATAWSDAPLPIQLTNFAAIAGRSGVDLTWSTATELNNYGFEIERRMVSGSEFQVSGSNNDAWTVLGFVRGAGTSTAPQEYSYSDFGLDAGRYAYRIKQIDFGGAYTYYSAAEVEVGLAPKELALEPNYPNPFNPATNITFTVPQDGPAVLKVFNMLGQEVATLFNEEAVAGRLYKATFDASTLPTGVYVSRLEFGGQAVMRKMLFVK